METKYTRTALRAVPNVPRGAPTPHASPTSITADAELVSSTLAGSNAAFDALVDRYRAPVVRLAYHLTHDRDDADDVAQEAFIKAYRYLPSFRPSRPFSHWLFTIARNSSLDAIRRRRRALAVEAWELPFETGPDDVVVRFEEATSVREALARLPDRYRTVLELYYDDGLAYHEIATRLTVPLGTIKTHLARAKRRLQRELLAS